jgi:L-arabinokinase
VTDIDQFLALLASLAAEDAAGGSPIDMGRPIDVARAPGRLDVMGGIADYSGSLVLELPTAEATRVAAQPSDDDRLTITSMADDGGPARKAVFPMADIRRLAGLEYGESRAWFRRDPANEAVRECSPLTPSPSPARGEGSHDGWAAYVAGVLLVLLKEQGVDLPPGLRIVAQSSVPEAKGVSSSAALEVASLQAVSAALGCTLDGMELARLCQLAENHVVGAPCGIMDQMTSALGRADHLLALRCQPAEVQGFVRLPAEAAVWGIDSGIRHAVSGSDYTSVRTGAFMGYRMLADWAGLEPVERQADGVMRIADPRWHGYLANIMPEAFRSQFEPRLPEQIAGADFLRHYGGTTDTVTRVDPDRVYAVRQPTAHPVYENHRVQRFADLLPTASDPAALAEMGTLMYASHASYSACGLGSDGTDRLVAMVREAGPAMGLFGAKITGGGSGGTVAVLGRSDAGPVVAELARRYAREAGRGGYVFCGSSAGACQFGVRRIG